MLVGERILVRKPKRQPLADKPYFFAEVVQPGSGPRARANKLVIYKGDYIRVNAGAGEAVTGDDGGDCLLIEEGDVQHVIDIANEPL